MIYWECSVIELLSRFPDMQFPFKKSVIYDNRYIARYTYLPNGDLSVEIAPPGDKRFTIK